MSAETNSQLWTPDSQYYQDIASSDVNSLIHVTARAAVKVARLLRFGMQEIVTTPAFDAMDFSGGNTIVAAVHRDELDTVLLPGVLEKVGIHHARPVSKIELFQPPVLRWGLHKLGAFAVDRKNPDMDGFDIAHAGILGRGGNITNYAEGTRVRRDVLRVAKVKSGVARVALANDSWIVPVGFAGLSSEKDESGKVARRDSRKWLSMYPKLVFALGDPFKLEAPKIPVDTHPDSLSIRDTRAQARDFREMNEQIREAMQTALSRAYEVRGSALEEVVAA